MIDDTRNFDRRTVLKATGTAGAATLAPFAGTAAAEDDDIDDAFDMTTDALQEALVVFDSNDDVDRLGTLDLADGYYKFEVLPVGYAELTVDQIRTVADWESVRYVQKNVELDYYNDDSRAVTDADRVQSDLGYRGDGVHVAVVDTGIDGDHPDLDASIAEHWQWVGNPLGSPTLWERAGDTDSDTVGHGTHVAGSVAGDGTKSDGQFEGMAPAAALTAYSTNASLFVLKATAAYDHLLDRVQDGKTDVKIVSNSYGSSAGNNFNPDDALNVATWRAFQTGLLSVFAGGNSGPDTNTLNQYAKGPHVQGVAATRDDKTVTDFSSRGRTKDFNGNGSTNWDRKTALDNLRAYYADGSGTRPFGVYRPGLGAPGNLIVSTMSPDDTLQSTSTDDGRLWYATISGTSMSTPMISGIAALVTQAYRENNAGDVAPIDLLNTINAEAEDVHASYTPYNIGAGFVDAYDAAVRAENGNLASFGDVTLVSN